MIYPIQFDTPHAGLEWLEYYGKHDVYHPGFDLNIGSGNADLGHPIKCPVSAEVEYVSPEPSKLNSQNGGFGWFVVLYHPAYGVWTRYAHMNKVSVATGQKLAEGENIGEVGKTGTTSAHLHFEGWKLPMFEIQKKHWRKFAYYPSGQTKQYIVDHYFDPLAWLDGLNKSSAVSNEGLDWLKEHMIVFGDHNADSPVKWSEFGLVLKRLAAKIMSWKKDS